jgi:hypothetical protein
MDKEKNNALTEQFKKVKSGNGDAATKKRKGSFLGGDVDVEDLPKMKFETKSPVKKRTPEEIEASRLALDRSKPEKPSVYKEPSLLEKAMRLGKAAIDVNVGRAQNDYSRMNRGYRELEKGF